MTLEQLWSEGRHRLRAIFRRTAVERELRDEVQFHIVKEVEKLERLGVPRDEAFRMANVSFGGVERIKDDTRDVRGVQFADNMQRDLVFAARGMRARPWFSATIVIIIALGVGVNAAMFGVLDRALFRTPTYLIDSKSVNRLHFGAIWSGSYRTSNTFAYTHYTDFQKFTRTISEFAAFTYRPFALGEGEGVSNQVVGIVTASYFKFFRIKPIAGRFIDESDDVAGAAPVAVLSHSYWKSHYARSPEVVGSHLRIDEKLYTIIGIAPEGFEGVSDQRTPGAFISLNQWAYAWNKSYADGYGWTWLRTLVRRREGVTVAAATTDLTNALRQSWIAQRNLDAMTAPVESAKPAIIVSPLQLGRGPTAGPEAKVMLWISGVAFVVLLIASANVANLLLARAFQRRQEFAVRRAIGGSRARLIQQLLTETALLTAAGGALGAMAAVWSDSALRKFFADESIANSRLDARTMAFAFGATVATALLAAMVPAFYSGRDDLAPSLRAGTRESAYRRSRTRSVLLVAQVAMSVVLLVGAGLFVKSLDNVRSLRLGYDPEQIVVAGVGYRGAQLSKEENVTLAERMIDAARSIPGVINVAQIMTMPFESSMGRVFRVPGVDSVGKLGRFVLQVASPDYFATAGTRIIRGRAFDDTDRATGQRVVVVSASMAKVIWKSEDPLGKCMRFGADTNPCTTVVGVAETTRNSSLRGEDEFLYYLPIAQYSALYGAPAPQLFVRVDGRAEDFQNAVRAKLQPLMPGASYAIARPFSATIDRQTRSWQFGTTMFVGMSSLALLLAAIGVYAVVAFGVAQRGHELSVRVALGAHANDLLQLVIGEGLRYILTGVLIGGVVVAFVGARLQPMLFDVSWRDPMIYGAVISILLAVGTVACTLPAVRATRVNPNAVLRGE